MSLQETTSSSHSSGSYLQWNRCWHITLLETKTPTTLQRVCSLVAVGWWGDSEGILSGVDWTMETGRRISFTEQHCMRLVLDTLRCDFHPKILRGARVEWLWSLSFSTWISSFKGVKASNFSWKVEEPGAGRRCTRRVDFCLWWWIPSERVPTDHMAMFRWIYFFCSQELSTELERLYFCVQETLTTFVWCQSESATKK